MTDKLSRCSIKKMYFPLQHRPHEWRCQEAICHTDSVRICFDGF